MPQFSYTAFDAKGKEQKGRIEADSRDDATSKLKAKGLTPSQLEEAGGGAKGGAKGRKPKRKYGGGFNLSLGAPKLRQKSLTSFTRQLATLLDAGLPLVRALRTLERQARDIGEKTVVSEVADAVEGGMTFSEALNQHGKTFDKLYVNMIRAGEASGALEQVLTRLAEYMEKAARLKAKVKSALVYPVVVLVIALSITSGLMIFIVPKFAKMFDEMLAGEPLPMLTNIVISISDFMLKKAWMGVVGLIVFAFLFKMFKKTAFGSYFIDLVLMKTPPINNLVIKSSVARFCSTLGTLMSSGVSVLNALQIVRDTSGNQCVSRAVQVVHDAVKEGEGMAKPLESTNVFPIMVVSMIEVGEETGALPEMLARVAKVYEEEVDLAVEAMTSLIEPLMIVVLGVLIGGIVLAMFMPLIKLIDSLGGG